MMKERLLKWKTLVQKGEITHHNLFLILLQCFLKYSATEVSKNVYMWKRVNGSRYSHRKKTFIGFKIEWNCILVLFDFCHSETHEASRILMYDYRYIWQTLDHPD